MNSQVPDFARPPPPPVMIIAGWREEDHRLLEAPSVAVHSSAPTIGVSALLDQLKKAKIASGQVCASSGSANVLCAADPWGSLKVEEEQRRCEVDRRRQEAAIAVAQRHKELSQNETKSDDTESWDDDAARHRRKETSSRTIPPPTAAQDLWAELKIEEERLKTKAVERAKKKAAESEKGRAKAKAAIDVRVNRKYAGNKGGRVDEVWESLKLKDECDVSMYREKLKGLGEKPWSQKMSSVRIE